MCDTLFMNECDSLNDAVNIDTRQKVLVGAYFDTSSACLIMSRMSSTEFLSQIDRSIATAIHRKTPNTISSYTSS
jgi:hypothetical protein